MRWASDQACGQLRRTYISGLFVVGLCLVSLHVRADGAIDAWARWALAPKVWKGQTVPAPEPTPRPTGAALSLASLELPVRVHVPRSTPERRALRSLRAFEAAYSALDVWAWPLPSFDGGYGGHTDIDLYVVEPALCRSACAAIDRPLLPSDFDAAQSYALIASTLPAAALEACALSALAQAGLRAVDPSEAESWVRASAELAVWQLTGQLGCDDALAHAQAAPERGLLNADPESAAAGALLLAVLSERLDEPAIVLMRNLWESTRQHSAGLVPDDRLRSSPDLWEVLRQTLESRRLSFEEELIAFGVARYFSGPPARRAQAPFRALAALPSDAAVPITRDIDGARLPAYVRDQAPLRDVGSAYVRVHWQPASQPAELQVWLHGELGARWSLTAVRVDASGREVGRTSAPVRDVPSSYLPIVLGPEVSDLLLVVTQLPERTPDADRRADTSHGYELIVSARGR